MLPELLHILLKLTLFLNFVSPRVALETVKTQLPGNRIQIKYLADSVCSDLEYLFQDEASTLACPVNFWNPVKDSTHRTEVKVRCRSKEFLQIEVTPSDNWQLVVLLSETSDEDGIINYSLIEPKSRYSEISVFTPSKTYIIFSTVLNKEGRPSFWHEEAKVPAWSEDSEPQHREYDLQVQFVNYTRTDEGQVVTGVVTWNHTGDSDVCFDFSNVCSKSRIKSMKIWPDKKQRAIIEKLQLDDKCEVEVTGLYGTTALKYRTPARDAYKDKDSIPKEASKESPPEFLQRISLMAVEDGDESWQVRVKWAKPMNLHDRYNLTLGADNYKTLVVPGNATEAIFTNVTGKRFYNVSVFAYKGGLKSHTFVRAVFPARREWRWAGIAGGAWGAAAFGVLAITLCWLKLRKIIYAKQKTMDQESKPLDEDLDSLEVECDDQWEVKAERLLLHEVIGEGAFGVVRRGTLAPTGKEVAVKMLKEYPSIDEVRAFRLEMELMKSVGAHPHVVSLVGCCSGKRPLIVAEYCARGDLLSFLRCSWDVMVSKRNAKYYNNNIEADYRNDLFKCKIEREHSRLVVNKMYDLQSICDSDLTSLDLLSFCRQIAMGMEFLANNRLVHRDLAARNVLVTGDKTLKIADFGLSRDVYEENQYKQTGNGKMPVKWMALESLTRRIYTSQSDVWAFGVVLWEVATVGAAPYPEVPAARLPRLLRAGYRMPRPPNCSKQLYELMLCCWRARPRERPTFAELHQRLDELLNSACAGEYLSLELDDDAAPAPKAHSYFEMIIRGKRAWSRENYERPLKAVQGNYNHYTSPPVTLSRAPV